MEKVNMIATVISALATLGAFLFLFRKDKDKQSQIDRLNGITAALDAQNETMKKQNELYSRQVTILQDSYVLQGKGHEVSEKLVDIEREKLRLSVKPNLWTNGGGFNGSTGDFDIDLSNKGETAILLQFNNNSDDVNIIALPSPYELEKGQSRKIFGRQRGSKHIKDCEIHVELIYEDSLKNKYRSVIKGMANHMKIIETTEL
jgi:hypothetical protein